MQLKTAKALVICLAMIPGAVSPVLGAAQPPPAGATTGQHRYFVEYHTTKHHDMQVKGPYKSRKHAHHVAHQMQMMGIKAKVVQR